MSCARAEGVKEHRNIPGNRGHPPRTVGERSSLVRTVNVHEEVDGEGDDELYAVFPEGGREARTGREHEGGLDVAADGEAALVNAFSLFLERYAPRVQLEAPPFEFVPGEIDELLVL